MLETSSQSVHKFRNPWSDAFIDEFSSFLISKGCVEEITIRRAKKAQVTSGERFDLVLLHLALIAESELTRFLAEFLGLELIDASRLPTTPIFADRLNGNYLISAVALPIFDDGTNLVLAMSDAFNAEAARAIGFAVGRRVKVGLLPGAVIKDAINRLYRGIEQETDAAVGEAGANDDARRLNELASRAPIIRLVSDLIERASTLRASDIHLEPKEQHLTVRMRIDGFLHSIDTLSLDLAPAVTSRVKIMAGLNIAERRLPQDGRIRMVVRGREIDLRISTMPTVTGESVVLRMLDATAVALDFETLGFDISARNTFENLILRPNGIVLVAGPTGSGKTTTLYTALRGIDCKALKVITVEDPVEYRLSDVNQIQVQPKIGLTFASVLRSTLRQDPDVVLVGEIRDLETARIAVQAALTGHLVLSTIHTNNAIATVARLLDMGVERYLLAATLKGVLSQRLVRKLCRSCALTCQPSAMFVAQLQSVGLDSGDIGQIHRQNSNGCEACKHTGFDGRTMIAELMTVGGALEQCIISGGTQIELQAAACSDGMTPMIADGLKKVLDGTTALEEVLRVTGNF